METKKGNSETLTTEKDSQDQAELSPDSPESSREKSGDIHENIVRQLNQLTGEDVPATADAGAPARKSKESPDSSADASGEDSTEEDDNNEQDQESDDTEQEEDDEASDNAEESEEDDDSELPKGVRRTLHELREERRQLREERDQIHRELAELRQQAASGKSTQAQPESPVAKANSPDALQKVYNDVSGLIHSVKEQKILARRDPAKVAEWLKANNVELPTDESGAEDITPEALRDTLENIELSLSKTLSSEIPARADFMRKRSEHVQFARESFDWFNKPESPEYKSMLEEYEKEPVLHGRPDAVTILGYMIEGKKVVDARAKAKKAGLQRQAKPAPSAAGRATSAAPRVNPRQTDLENARKSMKGGNGRVPDATKALSLYLNEKS